MSKHFTSIPSDTSKKTSGVKDETRFVNEPLRLQTSPGVNPHAVQKRKEASEAALDVVSMFQNVSRGQPLSNQQVEYSLDKTRKVLRAENRNPNIDEKGRRFIANLIELIDNIEVLNNKKNADEDFQMFWYYFIRSLRDLSRQARQGELKPGVDRFKVESLFNDIRTLSLLVVQDRQFRRLLFRMGKLLQGTLQTEAEEKYIHEGGDEYEDHISGDEDEEHVGGVSDSPRGESIFEEGQSRAVIDTYDDMKLGKTPPRKTSKKKMREQRFKETKKESQEVLVEGIHNLLVSLSGNVQFQRGIRSLFSLIDYLQSNLKQEGLDTSRLLTHNMTETIKYWKIISRSFVGREPFDNFFNHLKRVILFVKDDEVLVNYFRDIRRFSERAMTDKDYLLSERYRRDSNRLVEAGREIGNEYYDGLRIKLLIDEGNEILRSIRNDPDLSALNTSLQNLADDAFKLDRRGNYRLDANTIYQMKEVIAPLIIEQLAYMPIPHIQSRTKDLDWDVDGIVFSAYDMVPEHIFVDTNLRSDIRPLTSYQKRLIKDIVDTGRHEATAATEEGRSKMYQSGDQDEFQHRMNGYFTITIANMKTDLKDVRFSFNRKKFPKLVDEGLANIAIAGNGCTIRIRINVDNRDIEHSFFTGGLVRVKISKLKIRMRETKRDGFYNFITKTFSKSISKKIEEAIAQRISQSMGRIIENLNRTVSKVPSRVNSFTSSGSSIISNVVKQLTAQGHDEEV